jgi:tyrosine-protein kinase Etk/Wzc
LRAKATFMGTQTTLTERAGAPRERFQVDILDLLLIVSQKKQKILISTFVAMVLTAGVVLLLKNNYTSTSVILPPRQDTSMSMLLSGQLGALSSLSGMSSLASGSSLLKNPNDIYAGLLESRTVSAYLVDRFNLKAVYKAKTTDDAIKALASHTKIELSKDNLIHIAVTSHDAIFSSHLANAYVERLHELNTTLALTDSSQRRLFYEQQLDQEQAKLSEAELALRDVQQKTGIMQPAGQAELISRNIATIRVQLSTRQAELQSLRAFAADDNPDYIRVREQVASLEAQLRQAEDSQRTLGPGDIEVPTAKLPNATLEFGRKYRDVKLHEAVYEALVKQYEAAKLDEAKTAPMIQVVDRAVPAERKSGPPRTLIVLGSGIVVFCLLSAWEILMHGLRTITHDDESAAKLDRLRRQLSFTKD